MKDGFKVSWNALFLLGRCSLLTRTKVVLKATKIEHSLVACEVQDACQALDNSGGGDAGLLFVHGSESVVAVQLNNVVLYYNSRSLVFGDNKNC